MLVNTLTRAKELALRGVELFASPALRFFYTILLIKRIYNSPDCLENFIQLDDNDIWTALKVWSNHSDVVLSTLSRGMINRKLFKVEVTSSSITKARKEEILSRISKQLNINKKEAEYFLSISSIENNMYKRRMTVLKSSIKMEAPAI